MQLYIFFKHLAKGILPPFLWSVLSKTKAYIVSLFDARSGGSSHKTSTPLTVDAIVPTIDREYVKKPIYEPDIFKSYSDAGRNATCPWTTKEWLMVNENKLLKNMSRDNLCIHEMAMISSVKIAMNVLPLGERVTIIDIGGGAATFYPLLKNYFGGAIDIDYRLVENSSLCAMANAYFDSDPSFSSFPFDEKLETAFTDINGELIIHFSGTLECIEHWESYLEYTASYRPFVITVSRHIAPNNANEIGYVRQNIGYGQTAVVIIPRKIFREKLTSLGYYLVSEETMDDYATKYWENGCNSPDFYKLSLDSLVFVRRKSCQS